MSAPAQLVYDPTAVFVEVFSHPELAEAVGDSLDCCEVNALTGLLESHGQSSAAACWQFHHLDDCPYPGRHLR